MPDSWGSFMNKPARGWLHPDSVITRSSVCYEVRVSFSDYFNYIKVTLHKLYLVLFIFTLYN